MSALEALLIFGGGVFAGVINSMAGGGSLLTVPLLALGGVEGLFANGTNRVAVVIQNGSSAFGYSRKGVGGLKKSLPVIIPAVPGAIVGAALVSQIPDDVFERIFGLLMIPLLVMAVWRPKTSEAPAPWPLWLSSIVFFSVGFYAGAIQAGVGLILLLVLSRVGHDLVTANSIKTFVILAVSLVSLAIFVWQGQVRWVAALVLSAGTGLGGYVGANIAVEGGEKVIKPVLVIAVLVLAGRMVGLY